MRAGRRDIVNYDRALEIMLQAKQVGKDHGLEVSVAVVDAAGHPVLVARGRETAWHGPYMAVGKARLSAAFQKPTDSLMEQWKDRPMFPLSLTEVIPGGVTLNAGGHPIFRDDECIGAIGIGGGSPANDGKIARLTVEAIGALPQG